MTNDEVHTRKESKTYVDCFNVVLIE